MKKLSYAIIGLGLLVLMTGCRSNSSQTSTRSGLFRCFRGAPCNTCNPPVGQPANCGTNLAPSCDSCNGGGAVSSNPLPGLNSAPGPGVPYYPDTMLNGPDISIGPVTTQGYPPTYSLAPGETSTQIGSAGQLGTPVAGTSTEIETPPMYGIGNTFN